MTKQLKIVSNGPSVHNTEVFIDDQKIGFIQDIKFQASVADVLTTVEITLPDYSPHAQTNPETYKQLQEILELFQSFPHVKVVLKPIF